MARIFGIFVKGSLFLAAFVFLAVGWIFFTRGRTGETRDLIIPRGASNAKVSEILAQEGIIEYPQIFKLVLRATGGNRRLRAGEFHFVKPMRLVDALFTLYYDEPIVYQVTMPEGWTIRQFAPILARMKLVDEQKFVNYALSAAAAKKFGLKTPTLEGFLFPDTYSFSKIDGEERIVERMVNRYTAQFDSTLKEKAKKLGMTIEQTMTLASIIEKETGSAGEREVISSVFHNRLKKRMRLQSDPTTIYGIANFDGNLTRKHLLTSTPYNTYTIYGLPPGPIASPGRAAIVAALNPGDTRYLYFVANNRGGHVFSETYAEHARHVDNFQKRRRSSSNEPARSLGRVAK